MNTIKYVNPETGQKKSAKCRQGNSQTRGRQYPLMAYLDRYMSQLGYVRAGLRWKRNAQHVQNPPRKTKFPKWVNLRALYRKLTREKA